jgi:hypothetical protein
MSLDANVERWIELSRRYRDNPTGPCVLPIVKVGEEHYFVDERLRQLRNVKNVDEWMDFESAGDLLVFVMQHGGIVL